MVVINIVSRLLKLAPRVVSAVSSIASAARSGKAVVTPIPFGRRHMWNPYKPGSSTERLPTPLCVYCVAKQTAENEDALCPGPPARTSA